MSDHPPVAQRRDRQPRLARRWRRWAATGVLIVAAALVAMAVDVPAVETVRGWLPGPGPMRWLAATAALSAALLFPTPRSALSVLAGALFGVAQGLPLVLVGGLVGALAGFHASRWLGRGLIPRLTENRLARVDDLFRRHGLAAVLTARMMPAPPFAVVSYAAGLSSVRVVPYMAGTAIGLLPGSVVYVSIGASVMSTDAWSQWLTTPWLLALAAIAAGAAAAATWLRRRRRAGGPAPHSGDPTERQTSPTRGDGNPAARTSRPDGRPWVSRSRHRERSLAPPTREPD